MGFVLGLNGPAGCGKDTVGDYLVECCGWDKKLSFARNLKDLCKAVFKLSEHDVCDQEGKRREFPKPIEFTQGNLGSIMFWMTRTHQHYVVDKAAFRRIKELIGTKLTTPRHVLQFVGTDICRELIPTYHVDVLVHQIKNAPNAKFVITDVRFPNEGDLILNELEGKVAFVDRPNPAAVNIDRTHPSETAMQEWGKFSDTIRNHKEGLDCLYTEVNLFLERNNLCQDVMETQSSGAAEESSSPTKEIEPPKSTGTIQKTR